MGRYFGEDDKARREANSHLVILFVPCVETSPFKFILQNIYSDLQFTSPSIIKTAQTPLRQSSFAAEPVYQLFGQSASNKSDQEEHFLKNGYHTNS